MARLDKLPPYLFIAIDKAKRAVMASGRDVVDLGIGDPDRPTPARLVEAMTAALHEASNHRYPCNQGSALFRRRVAEFMARRHGVSVDPDTQVLALVGSKEGIAHLPLALLEEGERVVGPDLGYPVYSSSTLLAGGEYAAYGLGEAKGFLPDPAEVATLIDAQTRLLILNSPHNPSGAVIRADDFRSLLETARGGNCVVSNDAAYIEVPVGNDRPVSLLAVCDATLDRVIEFHSLSKTFNMTGWRIGFAVGHPDVIASLDRVKQNIDSGAFNAIQETAVVALGEDFEELVTGVLEVYAPRRVEIVAALAEAGIEVFPSAGAFYVWAKVPTGEGSLAFCARVLEEHALVVTPGLGFGTGGEGWFRISLTAPDERITEGARRLRRL